MMVICFFMPFIQKCEGFVKLLVTIFNRAKFVSWGEYATKRNVMAQVVRAFGYIKPHCAYLFCNKRGHRMKVLVHDGLGIWLCARRLEQGKFHWAQVHQGETVALNPEQLQALIQGLPWQRIGRQQVVTML